MQIAKNVSENKCLHGTLRYVHLNMEYCCNKSPITRKENLSFNIYPVSLQLVLLKYFDDVCGLYIVHYSNL